MPNRALRSWLAVLGWSPERLARRITAFAEANGVDMRVSSKAPYHWLNGARPHAPTPSLVAALLTEVTGDRITPSDLGWPLREEAAFTSADHDLDALWHPTKGLSVLGHAIHADRETRRRYAVISGMAMTAAAHRWLLDIERLTAVSAGLRADTTVVQTLDQVVAARRRMDDALGGRPLHRLLGEELAFVVDLLRRGGHTQAIEQRLYGVAAELARIAGWTCIDTNDHGRAQRYFLMALRAAQLSGDRALGAHVLGFMAEQALASNRPRDAVDLLNSAHAGANTAMSATEKAMLHGRLAYAHGYAGEAALTETAVDTAVELFAGTNRADDPPWIYWFDQSTLHCLVGAGYTGLNNAERAVYHLERAVAGLDLVYPRHGIICLAGLASAHLAAGHQEQAIATARDAADRVVQVDSDRALLFIGQFRSELAAQAGRRTVADFDDHLRSTLDARHHVALGLA